MVTPKPTNVETPREHESKCRGAVGFIVIPSRLYSMYVPMVIPITASVKHLSKTRQQLHTKSKAGHLTGKM